MTSRSAIQARSVWVGFSRFVLRFHRCPGLGNDPRGYLSFVLDLISGGRFDVLLPIHEQGFLFARVPERVLSHVAVALPSFESYARAHSKVGFSRLASELNLPQPTTLETRGAESNVKPFERDLMWLRAVGVERECNGETSGNAAGRSGRSYEDPAAGDDPGGGMSLIVKTAGTAFVVPSQRHQPRGSEAVASRCPERSCLAASMSPWSNPHAAC